MAFVRTVLGDVRPDQLGCVNYHEHLFQVTPLLPGDELDDEELSGREAGHLRRSGFDGFVDATPCGLGRRPAAVARIAAVTGLHVVATTGVHRAAHYRDDDLVLAASAEAMAARFLRDLTGGMPADDRWDGEGAASAGPDGRPVRAGIVKVGIGYWSIDAFAARAIEAAGRAHAATGAPVMVHLEHGSAGHEVLDRLAGAGVPAERVVLAHADRNPDPVLHAELAARGAYLGYDGAARHREWPDAVLVQCLADVVAAGGGDRVVLGGDVARRRRYAAYGGMPGLAYLGTRFVPRVRAAIGDAATDMLLRANPARLLAWPG
ncbi:phosphotriesterase family protein [Jiangella rhizosphaerae]|uniref:Aryldialkylphosphatase n=1 Tax=Jiangella rhizosphaerae TaxID=2293569 RepID=A0A418KL07_9ACTN|nr:aryldialkylphosphatase [Jiangella rhizosphaerae]RIQ17830.1 aryldialkylphosphatase [Jiangella rhizosphaerae]